MAFIKLQFKPGLNRDQTNYSGEGGWFECDKVRFRSGYPQKLGNFSDITPLRTVNPTLTSPNTNNCINVANGSATVTVN